MKKMFITYHVILILSILVLSCSAASRPLHHRHHHHNHTRHITSQHNIHHPDRINSTSSQPLKLTLVNAYPNGFFNSHRRYWNANENKDRDVEINWNREPTAVPSTTLSTTTMRSLRDRTYTKYHAGRNICNDQRTITTSVKTGTDCLNSALCSNGFGHSSSNGGFKHRITKQYIHNCCPGWAQVSKASHGCTKPICKQPCKNGGKCVKPETCSCPVGYSGRYCELDVNECQEEKPCDQTCYNTFGSYYCKCRDGFQLLADKQSCKKMSIGHDEPAFEAKDLENDIDYEELSSKISNIEKLIGTEKEVNNEIQKKIQSTSATMNQLRMRIDNMEYRQQELNFLKDKLNSQEMHTRKLDYLVDVLYKCRTKSSIFCPLQS